MPKFSIIIPVYNVAPYLRECLDSVLAQTFADWEAICVDDGSTDGSGAILDEYREKVEARGGGGQRIVVLHQKNAGVSAARNAALDVAQGEWIMFLDGDDVLRKDALQRVMEISAKESLVDVVQFERFRFGVGGLELPKTLPFSCSDIADEISGHQMSGRYLIAWHNAFKRLKCPNVRFRPYVCGEDRLYTFECFQTMSRVVHIPDRLYGYRERPMSYTTSVIKTFRGWEGELAYRLDFLGMASKSSKRIGYSEAEWLTHYLAFGHCKGFMSADGLTEDEKKRLFVQWHAALPILVGYSAFLLFQRLELNIQRRLSAYERIRAYFRLKELLFGPQCFYRRIYRRIRRHGEFANSKS